MDKSELDKCFKDGALRERVSIKWKMTHGPDPPTKNHRCFKRVVKVFGPRSGYERIF